MRDPPPAAGNAAPALSENALGMIAMTAAMAFFIFNDALVKLLAERLPLSQILFSRGLIATLLLTVIGLALRQIKPLPRDATRPLALRIVGELSATLLYLTALINMPLANATAIMQAIPLAMTVAAALLLGEVVRWRRWTAILVGFLGMLLIVRPGAEGFSIYSLMVVGAVLAVVLRDMSTRHMPRGVSSLQITLIAMACVALMGAVMGLLTGGWVSPTLRELIFLAIASSFLSAAFYAITIGARYGDVSLVSPFRYTVLLWAILLGWLIWGDLPDLLASLGAFLIIGSGLYVFQRERALGRYDATSSQP
ncbi:MAG: DMT family transporter [Pseudomonadota bacterium]